MGRGAYYLDIDPAACEWTKELMRAGLIPEGDVDSRSIADVQADDLRGYAQWHFFNGISAWAYSLRLAGWPDDRSILSGSCPCQSFSTAGKRLGKADERHLWPVMCRLVRALRPPVVVGEQVAAAVRHGWLDEVKADCEAEGYEFATIDIPVAALGGPHIRQRLWWVAALPARGGVAAAADAGPVRPGVRPVVEGSPDAGRVVVPGAGGGEAEGAADPRGLADGEVHGRVEGRRAVAERPGLGDDGPDGGTPHGVADAERQRAGRGVADQERPADAEPGRAGELPPAIGPGGGTGADGLADPERAERGPQHRGGRTPGPAGGGRPQAAARPERGGPDGGSAGRVADADGGERGRGEGRDLGADEGAAVGEVRVPDTGGRGGHGDARGGLADADGGVARDRGVQRGGEHGRQPPDGGVVPGAADAGRVGHAGGEGLQERGGDGRVQPAAVVAHPGQAAVGPGDAGGSAGRGVGHADVRGRGQADRPEQGGPAAATPGFWDDAVLIRCRDGKVRRIPAQSGVFGVVDVVPPVVDGVWDASVDRFPLTKRKIEGRVALLKGFGNAIAPAVAAEFVKAVIEALDGG